MALDELFQALNMFKTSMNEYSAARGISQAQDQVNELHATEMSAIEKRTALSGIANNLALNLAKTGAPVSQIQTAVGAVAPAPIKDAQDAYLQGTLAGSDELKAVGTSVQKFEEDPKLAAIDRSGMWAERAAAAKAKADATKADAKVDGITQKRLDKFYEEMDPSRGRAGQFGELTKQTLRVNKLNALFEKGPDGGYNMTEPMTEEVALGLHNLLSGSNAAHVEQVKALIPSSIVADKQKLAQWFNNNPEKLNNQAFMANLKKTIDREGGVISKSYKEAAYGRAIRKMDLRGKDQEAFDRAVEADPNLSTAELEFFHKNRRLPDAAPTEGSPAAASGMPPGLPEGSARVTVKNKQGQLIRAWKTPSGQLFAE